MTPARMSSGNVRVLRPRSVWRSPFVRGAIALPVVLALAYGGWGWWLQWRVERRLAALRAAGEPVYAEDFDPGLPPAETNGAEDLVRAGQMVEQSEEMQAYERLTVDYAVSLPLTDAENRAAARAVSANAEALRLLETGLSKPHVRWPGDYRRQLSFQLKPWLGGTRSLARLMHADALRAHEAGREDQALARVRQIFGLGRAVDQYPEITAHAVGAGIEDFAAGILADMASDLRVGAGPGSATPAEVRGLIELVLDDEASRSTMLRAMQNARKDDYLRLLEIRGQVFKGWPRLSRFACRPFVLDSADKMLSLDGAWIDAFRASTDLPATVARANDAVAATSTDTEDSDSNLLARLSLPGLERAVKWEYLRRAERRMAAVALAVRLYSVDHGGARPRSLAELVPTYLPCVPADPMTRGGAPLRYVSERATVYSAGFDGVDDGGSEAVRPEITRTFEPGEPVDPFDARDAVMSLVRRPRWFPQGGNRPPFPLAN